MAEDILALWKGRLGDDHSAYRNHVYRVIHFALALRDCDEEEEAKVVIAACFHDLGIWTSGTFDYLAPSIALADEHLQRSNLDRWIPEIEAMIDMHHKVTKYRGDGYPLVDVFRMADWVDVSLGLVRFGLPKSQVRSVRVQFPNAGFHHGLLRLAGRWIRKNPLRPVPVLKW